MRRAHAGPGDRCLRGDSTAHGTRGPLRDRQAAPDRPGVDQQPGRRRDEQADKVDHGGPDQAVYAYADEDADHWRDELQRDLPPGSFGENLRLQGVEVSDALIGTRWQVGGAVLQVTAPRIPCRVFAGFWDVPDLVKRFLAAGRPGAYLRVLTPGVVAAGDRVEVYAIPDHDVTVAEALRILTTEKDRAGRLVDVEGLATKAAQWAASRVGGG